MNRVECGSIAGERRALESVALKGLGESLGPEAEVPRRRRRTAAACARTPRWMLLFYVASDQTRRR